MANSIDLKELNELLTSGTPPILIDVRRKTDYEAIPIKIPGAAWRDPEQIDTWVKDLPPDRPTVVYCARGGSVSQSIADRLLQEGLQAVFLKGGLKTWTESQE